MKYYNHLTNASTILDLYQGREPFHHFIKGYFKAEKKFGSKDRRQISHLCYCYFRLGKAMMDYGVQERIVTGLFLGSFQPDEMLEFFRPDWNKPELLSNLEAKVGLLKAEFPTFEVKDVFWFKEPLSDGIERNEFSVSHFVQPDLFLRVRPGNEAAIHETIDTHPGFIEWINDCTLRLQNSTKLDDIIMIDKHAVIQDLSSQSTQDFLPEVSDGTHLSIWDCCAASGGKAIMTWDHYHDIELTVSDKRESILANLEKRFHAAGINQYQSFLMDLGNPDAFVPSGEFDIIVADVPCSGSGTWGRAPENLVYFDAKKVSGYQLLQRTILSNIAASVRPGGWLIYITCSVFKKENESNISFIEKEFGFTCERSGVISGYHLGADTMFAARFRKPIKAG
jgi:16S rRNA (cytosine967-C5)-methyltransferase